MFRILFIFLIISSCKEKPVAPEQKLQIETEEVSPTGNTVSTRFRVPKGYRRIEKEPNSYAHFLRNLSLKAPDAPVLLHNGSLKGNQHVHAAVIELPIGTKDLHQCADAVMRLRSEYLWNKKRYQDIHFNLTNGHQIDYTNWMQGQRIKLDGNKTSWYQATQPSNDYDTFWAYMELIFMYAGTHSLSRELNSVPITDMQIGDVLIRGGFPGHAVVVVDMCENRAGNKLFMLAQSYMPAQELHILINPKNDKLSPWYELSSDGDIVTPEWRFGAGDLKRF